MVSMKRFLSSAIVLSAFAAAPLGAQTWLDFGEQCSSGSMQTCASFQALAIAYDAGSEGTRTQLYFRVRNVHFVSYDADGNPEFGGSILAQFGVLSPDLLDPVRNEAIVGYDGTVLDQPAQSIYGENLTTGEIQGDPASYWQSQSSDARLGDVEWGLVAGSDGNANADGGILSCNDPERNPATMSAYFRTCSTGGWVTFAITAQGIVDTDELQLAWGVMSDSFEGESWQGTTGPPGEVVPEPMTMFLLGSGLAGVGAAARRRRKGMDIETG